MRRSADWVRPERGARHRQQWQRCRRTDTKRARRVAREAVREALDD